MTPLAAVKDADYTIEESEVPATSRSVAIIARGTPGAGGLIRPVAQPADVLEAQNETRAMVHSALTEGRDFGKIPGTKKKALLKAGAERVNAAFAAYPEFDIIEKEVDHHTAFDWKKDGWEGHGDQRRKVVVSGSSHGIYRYVLKCYLIHRESGAIIGTGVGSCSTMESKYIDRPRDLENTVFKMAKKRAYVDATLTAYGLSDEFTQDVEDMAPGTVQSGEGEEGVEAGPECPKCGGPMWDNREGKTNPKAPDYKCKNKDCAKDGGVYWPGEWPPKEEEQQEEDERTRLLAGIDSMIDGIRRISPERAKSASEYVAKELDASRATEDEIRKLGANVLAVLRQLEAEKEAEKEEGVEPAPSMGKAKKAKPAEKKPASEPADGLRGRYFALLNEKHGTIHDADRRAFQEKVTGKKSTADWTAKDFETAIKAVEAGKAADFICPM